MKLETVKLFHCFPKQEDLPLSQQSYLLVFSLLNNDCWSNPSSTHADTRIWTLTAFLLDSLAGYCDTITPYLQVGKRGIEPPMFTTLELIYSQPQHRQSLPLPHNRHKTVSNMFYVLCVTRSTFVEWLLETKRQNSQSCTKPSHSSYLCVTIFDGWGFEPHTKVLFYPPERSTVDFLIYSQTITNKMSTVASPSNFMRFRMIDQPDGLAPPLTESS